MEAIENNLVEGAILWLVQTILENLSISGKLDEWIRQVGLAEGIEKLRTEIERIETVVAAVKGRATGNKPLARSLARLRELMYDTDDVVDELDYFRRQQQVEGGGTACANNEAEGMDLVGAELVVLDGTSNNPSIASGSKKRKNQSKAWDHFVEKRDCNGNRYAAECRRCRALIKCTSTSGTNGLTKHLGKNGQCIREPPSGDQQPAPVSASDGRPNDITDATLHSDISKRMRTDEASTLNITATAYRWNKADASKKIHQITLELQGLRGTVTEFLKDSVASSDQYRSNTLDTRLRTTSIAPKKVYGRDAEKDQIIRVITAADSYDIAVLPIVGIAGVGKTALAQLVYNDPKVESQFERIWVCVSYNFDEVTLTREMLDFSHETKEGPPKIQYTDQGISGLGKLQEILKAYMLCRSKRFLLILDDVWDNLDNFRWRRLLLPLQSSHVKGNVILVTTRDLSMAQRIGTKEPIKLDVLGENDFWLLYKSFAFGDDNYSKYPFLDNIGQQIAEKLKGNPLTAETAGKILRERLNLEHWSRILKNEDWKSLQLRGGIMLALKLSYDQLDYHLKQCFMYCSIFPNNYQFLAKDLVRAWILLGFVRCSNSSKKLEDIGRECLTNLVNLGFLKQVERTEANHYKACYSYVICGIMHDFGRLVSNSEYATIHGLEFNKILPTIRHLSIVTDSAYLHDQHETIVRNEKFEKNLQSIFEQAGKLRTLVLLGSCDQYFFRSFQDMLLKVQNLRLLQISFTNCIYSFQGSLVSSVLESDVFEGLEPHRSLKHLQISGYSGAKSPSWLGASFSCLRMLHLEDCGEWKELGFLRVLPFLSKLKLGNMQKVKDVSIPSLEELVLIQMPNLERCSCDSLKDMNSSLRVLKIKRCSKLKVFSLFGSCGIEQNAWLSHLRELTIHDCPDLMVSYPLPPSSRICKLSIRRVLKLPNMNGSSDGELSLEGELPVELGRLSTNILAFHNLRILNSLIITGIDYPIFFSLEGFRQLINLKELEIFQCENLFSSNVPQVDTYDVMAPENINVLPSLKTIEIRRSKIAGMCLSALLSNVQALEELILFDCDQITGLFIENGESELSNRKSASEASSSRDLGDAVTGSSRDGLLRIPSKLISSLESMTVDRLSFKETCQGNKEVFSKFTSLDTLHICDCFGLVSSFVHNDGHAHGRWLLPQSLVVLEIHDSLLELETLQLCFPEHVTGLKKLEVVCNTQLESLQLHYCTALEELSISICESLTALEGLPSLGSLRSLEAFYWPHLIPCLERVLSQGYDIRPRLEILWIDDYSILTTSFCRHLTSLRCLQIHDFSTSVSLTKDFPVGLHNLRSLKTLEIYDCNCISTSSKLLEQGLPLPPSLEELNIWDCSDQLNDQCQMLATSKLKVEINGEHVN